MYGRRQWWARAGALAAATALHAVFVAPFVLGMSARKHPAVPDMQGAGASALAASTEVPSSMTLVDLSNTEPIEEPLDLASMGIELPQGNLILVSADSLPAPTPIDEDAIEDSEVTEAAGDTQGQAAMFGRYVGQVSARIERAWIRSRDSIETPRFSCEAKIEQDDSGRVVTVELRRCNGSTRWQRSLVNAIEHASPLPAPPVPSVFTRVLTLTFSADRYQAGASDERLYEPVRVAAATEVAADPAHVAIEVDKTFAKISQHGGAIDLRIEGKTVTWTLHEVQPPGSVRDTQGKTNIGTKLADTPVGTDLQQKIGNPGSAVLRPVRR